jgi:hypothetical protein
MFVDNFLYFFSQIKVFHIHNILLGIGSQEGKHTLSPTPYNTSLQQVGKVTNNIDSPTYVDNVTPNLTNWLFFRQIIS